MQIEGIIESRTRMIESQLKMYEQQELMLPTITHSKKLNKTKNTWKIIAQLKDPLKSFC